MKLFQLKLVLIRDQPVNDKVILNALGIDGQLKSISSKDGALLQN